MYNNQIQRKTITIAEIKSYDKQVVVEDTQGNSYSFFKFKKDTPEQTNAAMTLRGFQKGDTVVVTFKVNGQYNNAVGFYESNDKHPGQPTRQNAPVTPGPEVAMPPKDVAISAQAFAKSLLESRQATPENLVDENWWRTIIFPAVRAMCAGFLPANSTSGINVEDIGF